jgi:hypothetical protein
MMPSDCTSQDELLALSALRDLARKYQAVEVVLTDCGCVTVCLFVDGVKIVEEDKVLSVVVAQVLERIPAERRAG